MVMGMEKVRMAESQWKRHQEFGAVAAVGKKTGMSLDKNDKKGERTMAKYGTEVMLKGGISKEEIEETRRSIRIGDTVGYRMDICVTTDKDIKYYT